MPDTNPGLGVPRGTATLPETARPTKPPAVREAKPPTGVVLYVCTVAQLNALPPRFPTFVGRPEWTGSLGAWLTGLALYVAAGVVSAAIWTPAIALWVVLHIAMWINGHYLRTFIALAVGAALVYYVAHW